MEYKREDPGEYYFCCLSEGGGGGGGRGPCVDSPGENDDGDFLCERASKEGREKVAWLACLGVPFPWTKLLGFLSSRHSVHEVTQEHKNEN